MTYSAFSQFRLSYIICFFNTPQLNQSLNYSSGNRHCPFCHYLYVFNPNHTVTLICIYSAKSLTFDIHAHSHFCSKACIDPSIVRLNTAWKAHTSSEVGRSWMPQYLSFASLKWFALVYRSITITVYNLLLPTQSRYMLVLCSMSTVLTAKLKIGICYRKCKFG